MTTKQLKCLSSFITPNYIKNEWVTEPLVKTVGGTVLCVTQVRLSFIRFGMHTMCMSMWHVRALCSRKPSLCRICASIIYLTLTQLPLLKGYL